MKEKHQEEKKDGKLGERKEHKKGKNKGENRIGTKQ